MKTNANLPATKRTCGLIGSSDRENASKRQEILTRPTLCQSSSDRNIGPWLRRYTFKLYPNAGQEAALTRQAALLAHLWNAALEQREVQWAHECLRHGKGERKRLSKYDQGRELKFVRAADPEYAAMGSDTMNLCLIALDDAFRAFFKRAKGGAGRSSGYPRYKSPYAIENKGADCTVWHREHRKGWRLDKAGKHFRVYAKGVPGTVKARGRFPLSVDNVELRDMRLIRVSGEWFCSIVVKIAARRKAGAQSVHVKFDLVDEFASVKIGANGECLPGWAGEFISPNEQIRPTSKGLDEVRLPDASERGPTAGVRKTRGMPAGLPDASDRTDVAQSKRDIRRKKFSYRWRQETRRIAKQKAKEARRRREALHRWTTEIVAAASELSVTCPPIKESTKTARGSERAHGAAVKTVAALNRHVLAQAPALAIQMLEYKSAEAGIPFAVLKDDESPVALGRDLQTATKAVRKLRRDLKKREKEEKKK